MHVKINIHLNFPSAHKVGNWFRDVCFLYALILVIYILPNVFLLNPAVIECQLQRSRITNNISKQLSLNMGGSLLLTEPFCVTIYISCDLCWQDFGIAGESGAHETRCTMAVFIPPQPVVQSGGSNTHINAVGSRSSCGARGTRGALGPGWTCLKLNTQKRLLNKPYIVNGCLQLHITHYSTWHLMKNI